MDIPKTSSSVSPENDTIVSDNPVARSEDVQVDAQVQTSKADAADSETPERIEGPVSFGTRIGGSGAGMDVRVTHFQKNKPGRSYYLQAGLNATLETPNVRPSAIWGRGRSLFNGRVVFRRQTDFAYVGYEISKAESKRRELNRSIEEAQLDAQRGVDSLNDSIEDANDQLSSASVSATLPSSAPSIPGVSSPPVPTGGTTTPSSIDTVDLDLAGEEIQVSPAFSMLAGAAIGLVKGTSFEMGYLVGGPRNAVEFGVGISGGALAYQLDLAQANKEDITGRTFLSASHMYVRLPLGGK